MFTVDIKGEGNESMLPDRVSNPGPLTYESGALPIALCGPAKGSCQLLAKIWAMNTG